MPIARDLQRLKKEYEDRERRLFGSDKYSLLNAANLFMLQSRQKKTLQILKYYGFHQFQTKKILEIGCGKGGVLLEFLQLGIHPKDLFGIDIIKKRLNEGKQQLPASLLTNADGTALPFGPNFFDIAIQFTAFSSILDENIRKNIALEMIRVLKPDGLILWYDFWINPNNRQTKGIRPAEIRQLFPECRMVFHKITLAPPIARRIVPFSWSAAVILESLKLFNSHYLVAIQPLR